MDISNSFKLEAHYFDSDMLRQLHEAIRNNHDIDIHSNFEDMFEGNEWLYIHFGEISFEAAEELSMRLTYLQNEYEIIKTDGMTNCMFSVRIDAQKK